MKKSYYLSEPEGKMIFMMTVIFAAANILLKVAITVAVYVFLAGHPALDSRRLAAIIIGMMVADKFSIRFKGKEVQK